MSWPAGVYSLSHLAILFPIDDPLYGLINLKSPPTNIQIGNLDTRGERGVLRISERDILRLRCNPFWDYVKSSVKKAIAEDKPKGIFETIIK